MTVSYESGAVTVHLRTPAGEVPLGQFGVSGGRIEGTDQRGIRYLGTCVPLGDGLYVELTASVPAGTRISEGFATDSPVEHRLNFHLTREHLAGVRTKAIMLPDFGSADVRFTFGSD
jgi:hypothetical protein